MNLTVRTKSSCPRRVARERPVVVLHTRIVRSKLLVISCIFKIGNPDDLVDPDRVNFYFDDELVKKDENCANGTGWTWAHEYDEVQFCEEACERLRNDVKEVTVKFGCKTEVE